MEIITEPSDNCYIARIVGIDTVIGKGSTPEEAIGNLVYQHQDKFGIKVTMAD